MSLRAAEGGEAISSPLQGDCFGGYRCLAMTVGE